MKVAEIKISYANKNPSKVKIVSSKDVYDLILDHWDSNTIELMEEVKIILLNQANVVLGVHELSKGGLFTKSYTGKHFFPTLSKTTA